MQGSPSVLWIIKDDKFRAADFPSKSKSSVCWIPLQIFILGAKSFQAVHSAPGTERSHSFPIPGKVKRGDESEQPFICERVVCITFRYVRVYKGVIMLEMIAWIPIILPEPGLMRVGGPFSVASAPMIANAIEEHIKIKIKIDAEFIGTRVPHHQHAV